MRALRLDHHGRLADLDLAVGTDGTVTGLPAAVGSARIEALDITDGLTAWMDENGIAAGQPFNAPASLLASQLGRHYHVLRGAVVLTGAADPDGRTTALTDDQAADIRRRLRGLPA